MRFVYVKCVCDICGREEYIKANFNEWHALYEDALPVGWTYFDSVEFPAIPFNGDQCENCKRSFETKIKKFFRKWSEKVQHADAKKLKLRFSKMS